ncbi:MFS transporter [Pelagicoccus sp. SDUM812003]|uniref:MFS transporter n=1 Tax=Pelagicoccus sp. SDUM812003 TaxID=3041267 RepID=UPI00280D1D37|nr:MFS transporter [Pelagicoccus sp. SDUM812003]MDQ8203790.1 MFS transporter [Pelagicoccus sp. SDUM812003]
MSQTRINLFNFSDPRIFTLHITWFAFFLTFVMWFSHAPLRDAIMSTFEMSVAQWKALLILNVALTIPSRIVIGMLVDKFGPRHVYSGLLVAAGGLCLFFSMASSYEMLAFARLMMGFIGAGFVIGIRMIGEWFPARTVGLAEGIYGGWGNFGSAAAAFTLPSLMLFYGGENGWRYAVLTTGAIAAVYGVFFFIKARNTPKGSTYFKPKKSGGLEVTCKRDFYFLIGMTVPMYACLAVLAWKLSPSGVDLLSQGATYGIYLALAALFVVQVASIYSVNKDMLRDGVEEEQRYNFKQVAILDVNYFVTFGSELAVVSMLPGYFMDTFGLSPQMAGLFGGGFALMNLLARPIGGLVSDKFGRRATMMILICGLAVGYFVMGMVNSSWPIVFAVMATMLCSFFVQSGEGAVFAIVPLVKRRLSGQIAGMVGAYGNVGAVCFLTVYSFVDASTFFMVIGASSALAFAASYFLDEPQGHTVEVLDDGTVQRIEVA